MKMTLCPNKHFYDADKYEVCPHCAETREPEVMPTSRPRFGIPGKGRPGTSKTPATPKEVKTDGPAAAFPPKPYVPTPPKVDDDLQTEDIYNGSFPPLIATSESQAPTPPRPSEPAQAIPVKEKHSVQAATEIPHVVTLPSEIEARPSVPSVISPDDKPTIGMYGNASTTHFVVGWLVCVAGEEKGVSFPLKDGKNFIGRDKSMDVQLTDPIVSRMKHAAVQFDPRSCQFKAIEGESNGLAWLNNAPENIEGKVVMKKNDILKLGKTELMLIPCCDEAFRWDE